jgi:hypothetical protein
MNKLSYIFLSAAFTAFFAQAVLAQPATQLQPRTKPLIVDSNAKPATRDERKAMKVAEVKKLLESRNFVFKAQYANPLGGAITTLNGRQFNISPDGTGHIYLNYNYDVKVKPDSVTAYLPYYGRTTMAGGYNTDPKDSGVMFTSTKFGYASKTSKKGNTTITITPTDAKYNRQMILEVSENGSAQLRMTITNRNAISYDGYIAEK